MLHNRQRTLPTLWVPRCFLLECALPPTFKCILRPDKCTQTCIFRNFSFTTLALKFFFTNFLKVINKDYKPICLVHFSVCVCNIPNTFFFSTVCKVQQFHVSRDFLIVPQEPIRNDFSAALHSINFRTLILVLCYLPFYFYLLFAASFKFASIFLFAF